MMMFIIMMMMKSIISVVIIKSDKNNDKIILINMRRFDITTIEKITQKTHLLPLSEICTLIFLSMNFVPSSSATALSASFLYWKFWNYSTDI